MSVEHTNNKGIANGYCELNSAGNIPVRRLGILGEAVGTTDSQTLSGKILSKPQIKDEAIPVVDNVLMKVLSKVLKLRNSADTGDAEVTTGRLGVGAYYNSALCNIEGDSSVWGAICRIKDTIATPAGQAVFNFANSVASVFTIDNLGSVSMNSWLKWGMSDLTAYGVLARTLTDGFIGIYPMGTNTAIDMEVRAKGTGVVRLGGGTGAGLEVDTAGYTKPVTVATLPTASSTYRGKLVRVEGGAGVADKYYICEKNSAGVYYWKQLSTHESDHTVGGNDAFATTDIIDAICKRLLESGASTTLLLGAINDGQFLKRSGTAIVSAPATDGFGSVKIGTFTRDSSLASGTQAIIGVGFTPRLLICLSGLNNAVGGMSIGMSSGLGTDQDVSDIHLAQANSWELTGGAAIRCVQGSGLTYNGTLSSFDADGFTISWTKLGATSGVLYINYLALR